MSFKDGLKSGDYCNNPYCSDSDEFDNFERGCTQALKRGILNIDRLRADFDYSGRNHPEYKDWSELKGSKLIKPDVPKNTPNAYVLAKGR